MTEHANTPPDKKKARHLILRDNASGRYVRIKATGTPDSDGYCDKEEIAIYTVKDRRSASIFDLSSEDTLPFIDEKFPETKWKRIYGDVYYPSVKTE